MLGRRGRTVLPAFLVLLCAFLGSPASARAADGLYLRLGVGYGEWTGDEVVTEEQDADGDIPVRGDGCCPSGTLATQLRIGFAFLGSVGIEGVGFGSGWGFDSETSGSGFIGGGLRFFPLGFLEKLEMMSLEGVPVDFSLGASFGYAITGSNAFAYDGTAFGTDLSFEYLATSFMSVGISLDLWFPFYDSFAITSMSDNEGRCLDENGSQVIDLEDPRASIINRDDSGTLCPRNGRGPNTTIISPQIYVNFRFDLI